MGFNDVVTFLKDVYPLLALVVGPGVGFYAGRWNEKNNSKVKADIKNFEELKDKSPNYSLIKLLLDEQDLNNVFQAEQYYSFHDLVKKNYEDKTKRYHSKKIDDSFSVFWDSIDDFIKLMANGTFPIKGADGYSIRRIKYQDAVDDFETGNLLNDKASKVFKDYNLYLETVKNELLI